MPIYNRYRKGVMIRMETTDMVVHKGEKEEKYELYVEDYVMSYLKNLGTADGRKIFFYGTREQKNKKYYIYGAGRQKNISYFVRYELLDEIVCRFEMDMPIFSIKEDSKRYELKGYYIFYQTNEAMQSYMIEQRKESELDKNEQDKLNAQQKSTGQSKIRPQDFSDIRSRSSLRTYDESQEEIKNKRINDTGTDVRDKEKRSNGLKGGVLAFQLSAVFLVLAAIIISSTNSYSKLKDLGQSAIEVFFAMENQEASQRADGELSKAEGTMLRLEDLDAELEKENQAAKQDEDDASETEGDNIDEENGDENADIENKDKENSDTVNADTKNEDTENDDAENVENKDNTNGDSPTVQEELNQPTDNNDALQSQEAFARNLSEYYQIEKGDTLCNISIKVYGNASKVKEICEINKIEDPDNIKYGQKIILP